MARVQNTPAHPNPREGDAIHPLLYLKRQKLRGLSDLLQVAQAVVSRNWQCLPLCPTGPGRVLGWGEMYRKWALSKGEWGVGVPGWAAVTREV